MKTLNQLKIGDIVYDLAAKFDAEDNNIKDTYSTKEYVTQKISEIVNSAPETLDTLNELAAALNNDSNFATTIITQLGTKVDKVEGKQLSTEDYTTAEKSKLAGLSNYNDNEVRELISALNLRLTTLEGDYEALEARVAALETPAA